jgi:hypothetical protein
MAFPTLAWKKIAQNKHDRLVLEHPMPSHINVNEVYYMALLCDKV